MCVRYYFVIKDPWVYPVIIFSKDKYVYPAIIILRINDILPFSQRIQRSKLFAPVAFRLEFVRYVTFRAHYVYILAQVH